MNDILKRIHKEHNAAIDGMFRDCENDIIAIARVCTDAIKANHKLIFCGNGGSACDAMHIAGEFVGRFVDDRRSLPALALTADTGIITAIANDYAYDYIFARQIEGLGQKGDVLIALSTSGKSPSVLKAIEAAKAKSITTVLLTGDKARDLPLTADHRLVVPSRITAHVQEAHMVLLHGLAALIEAELFQ
jgi:D-sedoheptulose 7-phosphate isomerase